MENNDIEIVNCKNCNIKPEFSSKYFFNLLKYYLNHQIYLVSLKSIKSFDEMKTANKLFTLGIKGVIKSVSLTHTG